MSDRDAVPVTVVIAARDESANVIPCIESVSWAAEVIVAEAGSTDDTVERARSAGARVIVAAGRTIGAQRNAAIAQSAHGWVFVLDADERATVELAREIRRTLATDDRFTAYRVRRRNHFLGREIRFGGWGSDRPVRLFRRELGYDERPVHEHVIVTGSVGALASPITHRPYASLEQWFAKLDRYSRWWAEQQYARGRRVSAWTVVLRPPARFLSTFLLRQGWRDGAHGAVLAALAACSVAAKYARLWELSRRAGSAANS